MRIVSLTSSNPIGLHKMWVNVDRTNWWVNPFVSQESIIRRVRLRQILPVSYLDGYIRFAWVFCLSTDHNGIQKTLVYYQRRCRRFMRSSSIYCIWGVTASYANTFRKQLHLDFLCPTGSAKFIYYNWFYFIAYSTELVVRLLTAIANEALKCLIGRVKVVCGLPAWISELGFFTRC